MATVTMPSSAPYSTLTVWRIDWRGTITAANASGWSGCGQQYGIVISAFNGYGIRPCVVTAGSTWAYVLNDWQDSPTYQIQCPTINYGQDSVFRVQKTAVGMTCETWNVDGTNYQSNQFSFTAPTKAGLSGTMQIGDAAHTVGTLAFLRGYSTTVPSNSKPPFGGLGGDLWDYEFGNNLRDSSGNGLNLTGAGSFSYSPAATYPPACALPTQATFRAGQSVTQLTGANSYPLNGSNSLSYLWQQIPGNYTVTPPSPLDWNGGETSMNPTVTGFITGSYSIRLTVTDSGGASTSCSGKFGAVATDANGSVVIANPVHAAILGSIMYAPGNPWPQYEYWGKKYAQLMIQKLAGQVAISSASATNPMIVTTSAPSGLYVGSSANISGAAGTGCSGMNATFTVSAVSTVLVSGNPVNLITIPFNGTGCSYTQNSALIVPPNFQFVDYWNQAQVGTITVSSGSQTVVGSGTSFTTLFCQGPANPTVPKNNGSTEIVVWYPIASSFGFPAGTTGRRVGVVNSCADDTHINVTFNNGGAGWLTDAYVQAGSGLNYAYIEQNCDSSITCPNGGYNGTLGWGSGGTSSPGNYYDNAEAFYAEWYRTGIDDYLIAARQMADRWWSYFDLDKGMSAETSTGNTAIWENRSMSMTGIFMRNADNPPYDYSPGIRSIVNYLIGTGTPSGTGNGPNWCGDVGPLPPFHTFGGAILTQCGQDVRDGGYALMFVAYDALFDSNPAQASAAATAVSNDIKYRWNGPNQGAAPWANYDDIGALYASWLTGSGIFPNFTASVTTGSSTITAQSGYTWTASNFNSCSPACSTSNPPSLIWITATGTSVPTLPNNSQGDAAWYFVRYANPTTLMLTQVDGVTPAYYSGATNPAAGWQVTQPNNGSFPGYFVQPFMIGILSKGFYFANQALINTQLSGGGYDTAGAALAAQFALSNANWMASTGVNSTTPSGYTSPVNGLYYIRQNPACEPPGVNNFPNANCDSGFTGDRDLNGEGLNVATFSYTLNPTSIASRNLGETLMAAMFAAPGDLGYDGYNVLSSDIGGYMYSGNGQHKWWGYYWGTGGNWGWASARIGGLLPPIPRVVQVSLDFRNASHALLTVTQPNGSTTQVTCASTPCPVTIDARQGDHLLSIKYLNSTNQVVIPATRTQVVRAQ